MNMSDMTKKLYPVTGMHCAACAGNVEKIVRCCTTYAGIAEK